MQGGASQVDSFVLDLTAQDSLRFANSEIGDVTEPVDAPVDGADRLNLRQLRYVNTLVVKHGDLRSIAVARSDQQ